MNERILVIEDEMHIQELLKYNLEKNGYKVILRDNGIDGLNEALNNTPDLILLDLMLPGMDGFEVCKRLRNEKQTRKLPVLMLTAKGEELDKVLGLELGADDYITKPFSIMELIARIRANLRRMIEEKNDILTEESKNSILKMKDLEIDIDKYEVRKNDTKIFLTLREFELLKMLIENQGKVLTRDFLIDKLWGYDYFGENRTVDVHIRHIRQKIGDDEEENQIIETIRGVGYRISNAGES